MLKYPIGCSICLLYMLCSICFALELILTYFALTFFTKDVNLIDDDLVNDVSHACHSTELKISNPKAFTT